MLTNLAMLGLIISAPVCFILPLLIHQKWTELSVNHPTDALSSGQIILFNLGFIALAAYIIGSVLPNTPIQLRDPNRLDEFGMVTLINLVFFSVAFAVTCTAVINLIVYLILVWRAA